MALDLRPAVPAEQQIAVPPRPTSRRPGILESKLLIPRQTHPLVARARLTDRLAADPQVPLVGVFAPAGSGKTTLLVQWAAMDRRPVAWLTLDERESDPTALLTYVAAAIDRATGLPGSVLGSVGGADPADWQTTLSQLGRALAATHEPLLVVLDDVERIGEGEVCEAVVALSALLPPGSQLALSSRRADAFPVPRLVTAGLLTLLERDDLALDDREAEELLRIVGWSGPEERARRLNLAFEGWAAGLYLSALTQRTGPEPAGGDDTPAAQRMVAAYVRSEVLGSLRADELDLVVRASAFEPLDASMIGDILGIDAVDASLRELARTTPLLIELDGPGTWYRWHRSLRAVVQAESAHRDPEAERLLQAKAALWYERAGLLETAAAYGMRAGDVALVARLLPGLAETAWNAGRVAELTTWLDWFDAQDGPAGYPRVAMIGSLVHGLLGRSARALRWATLGQVDHASRIADGDAGLAALVRASLCR